MTSEVCVLNRYAAVLAADSATTVTYGWGDTREERYFKGANKIFQLSDHEPVGMMVFDSADLLRVPWELIVKAFRRELGQKSFNVLEDYAAEFFNFIRTNMQLFPDAVRQESLSKAVRSIALQMMLAARNVAGDEAAQTAALDGTVRDRQASLDQKEFENGVDQVAADAGWAAVSAGVIADVQGYARDFGLPLPSDIAALVRAALTEVYKEKHDQLGTTGLVFAGFGDHDTFPSMIHYDCRGLAMNSLICSEVRRTVVDYETPAGINAFAQTSMTDTFTVGISFDVYTSLLDALKPSIASVADKICAAAGINPDDVPNLAQILEDARRAVTDDWMNAAMNEHSLPMRRVLGVLPIDELAELAETLIRLQSLKEKVTKPSETVGGPVDVAVITKNEGLVWIRRKHYFDADLNPRYIKRLGS